MEIEKRNEVLFNKMKLDQLLRMGITTLRYAYIIHEDERNVSLKFSRFLPEERRFLGKVEEPIHIEKLQTELHGHIFSKYKFEDCYSERMQRNFRQLQNF